MMAETTKRPGLNFSNEGAAVLAYNSLAKIAAGIFKSPGCEETDLRLRTENDTPAGTVPAGITVRN